MFNEIEEESVHLSYQPHEQQRMPENRPSAAVLVDISHAQPEPETSPFEGTGINLLAKRYGFTQTVDQLEITIENGRIYIGVNKYNQEARSVSQKSLNNNIM